jgi:hypothetical protein
MADKQVRVGIWHGDDIYMTKCTENDIKAENVPATARLLMDQIYLRLDDHVSTAKLRAHRRRLRGKRREQAVGRVETQEAPPNERAGGHHPIV